MRAFRSELIRIRRPAFLLGGIGLMALFAGIVSIFIYTSAETAPAAPAEAGQGPGAYTVAEIASEGGFLTALPTVSRLAGVILLSLWAIAVATDYSTGLIRILAQAHPNRTSLLGGKIAALSVFTLLATAVTTLTVVIFARPLAKLEGIPIDAWKTDFASHLGKGYFDFTVAGLVWGLIGLMLAVLTRSSAVAIGIGLGFLLVAEGLISIVAPDASTYLPGGTLDALASGGNDQLAWGTALGLVLLYGVIAATVSLAVFRTRDIVS
jgi:ABC-type transport system involved in multi-copper enzyme maturation permease subunit